MDKIIKRSERGVALPVMLIILVVMLISSVYLLKSSNTSTLTASNMAYDANLSMAADLGLQTGFQYLQARAKANKTDMNNDDGGNGYNSNYIPTQTPSDSGFWANSTTVQAGAGNFTYRVEYVIHRACTLAGQAYDATGNHCVQTSANPLPGGSSVAAGDSLTQNGDVYTSAPQLHYIVTARIYGDRGGNVVNQLVVLIDA